MPALLLTPRLPRPYPWSQLAVFGGDVVHNGLEHLAQLGLNASGLRRLLAEPVSTFPPLCMSALVVVACWAAAGSQCSAVAVE